jgi:hypothetical protein
VSYLRLGISTIGARRAVTLVALNCGKRTTAEMYPAQSCVTVRELQEVGRGGRQYIVASILPYRDAKLNV